MGRSKRLRGGNAGKAYVLPASAAYIRASLVRPAFYNRWLACVCARPRPCSSAEEEELYTLRAPCRQIICSLCHSRPSWHGYFGTDSGISDRRQRARSCAGYRGKYSSLLTRTAWPAKCCEGVPLPPCAAPLRGGVIGDFYVQEPAIHLFHRAILQ